MRTALSQVDNEAKRVHKEFRDLLEAMAVQQTQTSLDWRWPKPSGMRNSCDRAVQNRHHAENEAQIADNEEGSMPTRRLLGTQPIWWQPKCTLGSRCPVW